MEDIRNKNNNYQRIEKLIVGAFIDLSSKVHYSQISVTDLCKAAKVNRTTFYKHYRGTWEIKDRISETLLSCVDNLHDKFRENKFKYDYLDLFKEVNKQVENNIEYFKAVFNMKGSNAFTESIINQIKSKVKEGTIIQYQDTAFSKISFSVVMGGILNTYYEWFSGKLNCTLDELAIVLSKYMESTKQVNLQENIQEL